MSWDSPDQDRYYDEGPLLDEGPSVEELERDTKAGKRCIECGSEFTKKHNHPKTLCTTCGRLFIESRGYHLAVHRTATEEGHATRNRKRKNA